MKVKDILLDGDRDYFYIMHLCYNGREKRRLWNYATKKGLIGLDQPSKVTEDWIRIRESAKKLLSSTWIRQFDTFCCQMCEGDIILVLAGWYALLGVAEVEEDNHRYRKELNVHEASPEEAFFDHIRKVKWRKEYRYANRLLLPHPLKGFNNTLSKVTPGSERWSILTELDP